MNKNNLDQLGKLIIQGEKFFIQWAKKQNIHYPIFVIYHALINYGSCTQKRISAEWGIPKQTLSTLCRQLEKNGDIQFKEGEDRREKQMQLTAQGLKKAQPLFDDFTQRHQQAFAKLGKQKTEQTIKNMQLLNKYLKQYFLE